MKILVIGGGMAGLTYGILAAKDGHQVTVVERNARVGKKIAQTGNGKCNIGNANVSESCFNQSAIVSAVLSAVSVEKYKKFLADCGIYTYCDGTGRMYPLSDSASNVVDCLRKTYAKYGGKTLCETAVSVVRGEKGGFVCEVGSEHTHFDGVVLACGSASGAADPKVYGIVPPQMFTKLVPSLVPVKVVSMDKSLNGLRARAVVRLQAGCDVVAQEVGEVQFKDYGLSGICIFNLSAHVARSMVKGQNNAYTFVLDVVPQLSEQQLQEILQRRLDDGDAPETLFYGILHNKLAEAIVKRVKKAQKCVNLAQILAKTAKNLAFTLEKPLDFSMSQVTAGGISEKYVDTKTLSLPSGIVALGEVLDVDGVCGGNNLYFAAASAIYAYENTK